MQFSIVVPVFNEAGSVVPLLEEIRHAMRGVADYEVIYVDDGSIDDTALQLDQASQPPQRAERGASQWRARGTRAVDPHSGW
jgi:dolichol-phosphate mannosyltransferase